jgi:hypothetical protein
VRALNDVQDVGFVVVSETQLRFHGTSLNRASLAGWHFSPDDRSRLGQGSVSIREFVVPVEDVIALNDSMKLRIVKDVSVSEGRTDVCERFFCWP